MTRLSISPCRHTSSGTAAQAISAEPRHDIDAAATIIEHDVDDDDLGEGDQLLV